MAEGGARAAARDAARGVLAGYAGVYFSRSRAAGLLFLAATMTLPAHGLVGLFCAAAANAAASLMGLDRALIRGGHYALNALLVGLGLAYFFPPSLAALPSLAVAAVLSVVITTALYSILEGTLYLPSLSLAFALSTVTVQLAALSLPGLAAARPASAFQPLFPIPLPEAAAGYLGALGAVFFRFDALSGLLVAAGLLASSRIAFALSLLGYFAGSLFSAHLGANPLEAGSPLVAFNFILAAIAMGGVFTVPSAASYALGALAALTAAVLAGAVRILLQPYGIPVLSLPFVAAVYLFILGLRSRPSGREPELVRAPASSPEENLAWRHARRLGAWWGRGLRPPFFGCWVVTQGADGRHTHKERWRYALDFGLEAPERVPPSAALPRLDAYPAYQAPVLAPAAGVVARVLDGVPDNEPGRMDTERNWGNYVSLRHGDGSHSLLAHLKAGSLRVKEGESVAAGALLGLCGNSGRSPEPHIHLHLQRIPEPGGETLPFVLERFIVEDGDGARLEEGRLPREGERVRAAAPSKRRREAFSFPTGTVLRFKVEAGARAWEETLRAQVGLDGASFLLSERSGERLYYVLQEEIFAATHLDAGPHGLLFALFAAAPRVPLVEGKTLAWSTDLPVRPVLSSFGRLAADCLLPLVPGWKARTEHAFFQPHEEARPGFFGVRGRIPSPWPRGRRSLSTRALFLEGWGPMEIALEDGKGRPLLKASRLDAAPEGQGA